MTNEEKKEFKELIKEGTLEVFKSGDVKELIKAGALEALGSEDGKLAIVAALRTQEAKEVFLDNFTEAFHEVVVPILDNHEKRIKRVEEKIGVNI